MIGEMRWRGKRRGNEGDEDGRKGGRMWEGEEQKDGRENGEEEEWKDGMR